MTGAPDCLGYGLVYVGELGLHVVPNYPKSKKPIGDEWQKRALHDRDGVYDHYGVDGCEDNIGILGGPESGVWIFDVDTDKDHGGADTLADLEAEHGPLPDTWQGISGSGGAHYYFRWPADPGRAALLTSAPNVFGPGIDVRAAGAQAVAPPSIHPNGRPYAWDVEHDPFDGQTLADGPDWMFDLLAKTAGSTKPRRDTVPYVGDPRPGDRYAARHTWPEILEADGAKCVGVRRARKTGCSYELWSRPGLPENDRHASATLYYGGTDLLKVHTSNWPHLEIGETYTRFGYHTATKHGGVFEDAARALGKSAGSDWLFLTGTSDSSSAPDSNDAGTTGERSAARVPVLPEKFWAAQHVFGHIRQAARARRLAPDAVLVATLVRIAALTDYRIMLPPVVGRYGSLNYAAVIAAPSGLGKGSTLDTAQELLPAPLDNLRFRDDVPAGSGEGMARAYFKEITQAGDDGKTRTQWEQWYHAVLFRVDEGSLMRSLGDRTGQTTMELLLSGWSGEQLGGSYSGRDKRGFVCPKHSYRFAFVMGVQPEHAGWLLDAVTAGTPQRFLWATCIDCDAPDIAPDWPGPLDWKPPDWEKGPIKLVGDYQRTVMTVAARIAAVIGGDQLTKLRGDTRPDPLDSHRNLVQLKTAAVLTILDNRFDIGEKDWELAAIVCDTSRQVREAVGAHLRNVAARTEGAARARATDRVLHTDEAREQRDRRRVTAGIVRLVRAAGAAGITRGKISKTFHSRDRWLVNEILDELTERGEIVPRGDGRYYLP